MSGGFELRRQAILVEARRETYNVGMSGLSAEIGNHVAASDAVVSAWNVGKCYEIYARPVDRLKQALWRGRRRFYQEFWALREVSFEVRRGEAFGIIGRNGAGKSTLLQIIAGTTRPSEGEVRVAGRVHALLELGSGFNPEFTGRENVHLNGAVLGLSPAEVRQRFDEIAAFADIGMFIDQPVKTYSTGMAVRLAFAVQAVLEPEVLIVDEALAVGDAAFQAKCFRRIAELRERGTTILLVTHDTTTVATMCERALLLQAGRAAMVGTAKDVAQEYYRRVQDAQLREAPAAPAGGGAAGGGVEDLEPVGASSGLRQGDGRAEVAALGVFDARNHRTRALAAREPFRVDLLIRFNQRVENPHVGAALRDKRNMWLLGGHTMFENVRLGPCEAGDEVRVCFELTAFLNPGTYLLMFGVADHATWSAWVENDVFFDYCEVEVYGEQRAWGLVNAPAKVSVRRLTPVKG